MSVPKHKADDKVQSAQSANVSKEIEPAKVTESELVSQIIEKSEALDKVERERTEAKLSEIREAHPEPEIPQDAKDAGLKSPSEEASKVAKEGSSLDLPISEQNYNLGIHQRIKTKVVDKVVVGASNLFALATWVGRRIKMAHKFTMKVVFRKPSDVETLEGKEDQ